MIEETEHYEPNTVEHDNVLKNAAAQVCQSLPSVHQLRVFYHLKYGPYPFFFGEFSNNVKEGNGLLKYKDGSIYRGQWSNDKKHGRGEMFYENGDKYDGEWQYGKKTGEGQYYFSGKGCNYSGVWIDGKITNSRWNMDDGIVYNGEGFTNNLPDGPGFFSFPDFSNINLHGKFVNTEWIPSNQFIS